MSCVERNITFSHKIFTKQIFNYYNGIVGSVVRDAFRMSGEFEAAVGMSRKWDAREAGREVAQHTLDQLSHPPKFFLLFSTIHYEKHGGFEEFLKGVWEVLPEGTPLVGGTVVGFMNNYGSYTHGASALAVCSENMDVAVGFGKNTKRNPKKAAITSAGMIEKKLEKSNYQNRFLLNFVSGPETWKIPGQGYKKIVNSGFWSRFGTFAYGISQYLLQKGSGREDEIFEKFVELLPNYNMLLGASMDDYKGIKNFQFFQDTIFSNSVVTLGFCSNMHTTVSSTHGMKNTDISFKITKLSKDKHIIKKINGKPPVPELLRLLEWPDDFLTEKTLYNVIPYYPISFSRHGREVPTIMPGFLKDNIVTPSVIDTGEVSILTTSGKDIVDAANRAITDVEMNKHAFGIISTCVTILTTLGAKTEIIRQDLLEKFNKKPFLLFFSAGEGTYSPDKKMTYANISFNAALFKE